MHFSRPPLVSILIPAFNAQDWIAQTIRSAESQTWSRKEVIIVDDGSRDGTLSVARKFESKNVRVVSTENQGAAAARNTAFSFSQGDYIQWLDADDLLAADKIAEQLAALSDKDTNRTLLSGAWATFAYRPDRARFSPTSLWEDLSAAEWLLRKMGDQVFMANSSWLTSRRLSEDAGPWDTSLSYDDDGEYFSRVLLSSDGTRFVPAAKALYRNAATNRVSDLGLSQAKMDSLLRSMKLHLTYLRSLENSDRVTDACMRYLQNWSIYFDPNRRDIAEELQRLARGMGRELGQPVLRWKYAWLKPIFGSSAARRAQFAIPFAKHRAMCAWDRFMHRFERNATASGDFLAQTRQADRNWN